MNITDVNDLAMAFVSTYAPWLLFGWLAFETIWDLRDQTIPVCFSLAMLIPGGIVLAILVSPWAILLIAVSVASTEIYHRSRAMGMIGIFAPLVPLGYFVPFTLPLAVGWGILVSMWMQGVIGGADSLAGLALLLNFPSWLMIIFMLAGAIVWSLMMLIWQHGKGVQLWLWTVLQTRAKSEELPGIGMYALAILFYGLYTLVVVRP